MKVNSLGIFISLVSSSIIITIPINNLIIKDDVLYGAYENNLSIKK